MTRSNWAQALWKLHTQTSRDIPSTTSHEPPSFERWREYLDSPLSAVAKATIAVEGKTPVGILRLSRLYHGKMNIEYPGVLRNYRRRGLSVALKLKAFEHPEKLGSKIVSTQNHHRNPMFKLNQRLGFKWLDTLVEITRPMPRSVT